MKNNVFVLGNVVYAVLLVLSQVYYLERTAFVDIAFHLFYILKDGDFAIQNFRFVACFTQLFPLVSSKLGLDLGSIMRLYSASFVVLNAGVFYILTLVLRRWRFALALLFLNTLMVTHTFYWIQSELQQGMPVLILCLALIYTASFDSSQIRRQVMYYTIGVLLFVLAFAHPLIVFPFTFVVMYLCLADRRLLVNYGLAFVAFSMIYGAKFFFFKTQYDSGAMGGLNNFVTLFPNYLTTQSMRNFLGYLLYDYHFLVVFYGLILTFGIWKKQWLKLLLVTAFVGGYTLLVNLSYPAGADQFYIENIYLPLSIILGFPIAYELYRYEGNKYVLPVLCLLFVLRIGHIVRSHTFYSDRVSYLEDVMSEVAQSEHTKRIYKTDDTMKEKLLMDWGTSYEIWLISTHKYKRSSSIMFHPDPSKIEWALPYNQKFIANWGAYEYDELPKQYFLFEDKSFYKVEK